MQSTVTLKIKLAIEKADTLSLDMTHSFYVCALNETSKVAFDTGVVNAVALHHLTYQDIRKMTGLPSNLTCSARTIVAEAYKREPKPKKQHRWKAGTGMRYDARTLTLRLDERVATLTTIYGRIKVGLIIRVHHLLRNSNS